MPRHVDACRLDVRVLVFNLVNMFPFKVESIEYILEYRKLEYIYLDTVCYILPYINGNQVPFLSSRPILKQEKLNFSKIVLIHSSTLMYLGSTES